MHIYRIFLSCLLALATLSGQAQLLPNLGGQRVGISALTFLKNDLSPRSVGLAGSNVTLSGDAYSATINPAQVAELQGFNASVSNLSYGGGLQHTMATVYVPAGKTGVVYASVNMLNLASEKVRTEFAPFGTGESFAAYSVAATLGYSRALSDRLSLGVGVKYIREQLAQYGANALAADLGFLYRTDYRNLRFAAALQHFGANSTLSGNYNPDLLQNGSQVATDGYPAPTLFKMGAQIDAYNRGDHLLTAHAQLNHPNDNAENIRIAAEYTWAGMLMLRGGIKLGVDGERIPTAGVGFKYTLGGYRLQADYGLNPHSYLGLMHSVGISFSLNHPADAEPSQATGS